MKTPTLYCWGEGNCQRSQSWLITLAWAWRRNSIMDLRTWSAGTTSAFSREIAWSSTATVSRDSTTWTCNKIQIVIIFYFILSVTAYNNSLCHSRTRNKDSLRDKFLHITVYYIKYFKIKVLKRIWNRRRFPRFSVLFTAKASKKRYQ